MGITSEGLIVGWSTSASDGWPHAFRWTASGGMVDLGAPQGQSSGAMDANAPRDAPIEDDRAARLAPPEGVLFAVALYRPDIPAARAWRLR